MPQELVELVAINTRCNTPYESVLEKTQGGIRKSFHRNDNNRLEQVKG